MKAYQNNCENLNAPWRGENIRKTVMTDLENSFNNLSSSLIYERYNRMQNKPVTRKSQDLDVIKVNEKNHQNTAHFFNIVKKQKLLFHTYLRRKAREQNKAWHTKEFRKWCRESRCIKRKDFVGSRPKIV